MTRFPIAVALLVDALARLEQDHYSDGQNTECDGCLRASEVRREMETLNGED